MKINVCKPVAVRGVAEANAAPRAGRPRRAEKLDAPLRFALGKQTPLDEQPSIRSETNRCPGIDRQRDTRRYNQRLAHEQRLRRRPAGGLAEALAKRAGGRGAVPDIGVLSGDHVAGEVQRVYEQPVQPAPQHDFGLPPRFRRNPVGGMAVDHDRHRPGGRRLAGQFELRGVRSKKSVALGQAGGHGQLARDLRQHKLAALGSERFQPVDLGARQIIPYELVDHWLELLGRKHCPCQVVQVKPITRRHRWAAHQLAQHRVRCSAP